MADSTELSTDLKERYKKTVLLPKTEFPMRANLPQTEPLMIERWAHDQVFSKRRAKNSGRKKFVMPDGPPYANANIHMGTALNKILKDFVMKFHSMAGSNAVFVPGWDCHGLPIEQVVTKALGAARKDKTDKEIRALCRKEAEKWINTQRSQFIRLGVLADWQNPYLTMNAAYEAEEVRELARMMRKGVLYRGEKPVYWCPTLQTALAEAEVEYHNHKSPAIYVKFPVTSQGPWSQLNNVSFVIWTTTPWTLPSNLGLALHPDFDYGVYRHEGEHLILALGRKEGFQADTGHALADPEVTFKGSAVEGVLARHPFYARDSRVVLGDHVTLDAGTGVVHTAPGHGQEDYQVGLKYNLGLLSPVDAAGKFTSDVPEYEGVYIFDANPRIVERLRDNGSLLGFKEIEHSYPHNWRSKTPLIFRATPQWFLRMDDPQHNVRELALKEIDKLKFVPAWGERRLRSMVERRPDWCLSRQRIWGVPIPAFYCKKCEHPVASPELFEKVADTMESSGGIEGFWEKTLQEHLGKSHACEKCGHEEFQHSRDILDVWLDSGTCHAAVQRRHPDLDFPADIYLEGSDQHRGWFQSSLIASVATTGQAPYRGLVTHGFVNDMQGRKMSKSLGNYVDPLDVIKGSGAEIVRLWAAHEDYGQDLTCGPEAFVRLSETYRRFRNTFRFLLGNLSDFDPKQNRVRTDEMTPVDRWALGRLAQLLRDLRGAYEKYEFHRVYHLLNTFFTVDLSAVYLDVLKDRLYTGSASGLARRGSQTVFYELVRNLSVAMFPILSFLSEEVYGFLPGDRLESVYLEDFPEPRLDWTHEKTLTDFEVLLKMRSEVSKAMEEARNQKLIGATLEARISVQANGENARVLREYESWLPELWIVSQVQVLPDGEFKIEVARALGEKCVRCWNFSPRTNENSKYPGTCPKCWPALEEQGEGLGG